MDDRDRRRLLAKVARLYHHTGLRQTEIAERLRISQTRVSRLLQQAEAGGIAALDEVVAAGAVGQICLRFLDANGVPLTSTLDDLVTGVTTDQLRAAKRRWVVAGGPRKHARCMRCCSGAGRTRS